MPTLFAFLVVQLVYGAVGVSFDLAQTDHLLTTTRAVRKRLDLTRPVPRDVILECIRVAIQAPAGGNIQRWRWVIVDDPHLRATVAGFYRRAYQPYIEVQKQAVEKIGRTDASTLSIIDSLHLPRRSSRRGPGPRHPVRPRPHPADREAGTMAGFYGSILPSVWSFQLALRARGASARPGRRCIWSTRRRWPTLLGIPRTVSQVALLPVAYYTGDDFKPGTRRPAEEVIYWNQWKQQRLTPEAKSR